MTSYAKRIDILRRLDVDAALAASPYTPPGGFKDNGQPADTRETALAGMHKARVSLRDTFTPAERMESVQWLLNNGWRVTKVTS
jgi:hypothetical protein